MTSLKKGVIGSEGRVCAGGDLEARRCNTKRGGQGRTRPSSHQGDWWHRAETKSFVEHQDLALNFLAGISVPPLRPLSQGICGCLAWGGQP